MKRLIAPVIVAAALLFAPPVSANPDQDQAFISMLQKYDVGAGSGGYARMIDAAHEICNAYHGGLTKWEVTQAIYSGNIGHITYYQAQAIFAASVLVYCPPAGLPANQPLQPGQGWVA